MRLSKKQLIVGAALLSGSLLFFAIKLASEQIYVAKNSDVTAGNTSLLNQKDTDGDGLKDWEEVLWGTSRNNPDTDGDGMPDGEEVAQRRSPTVAGPGETPKQVEISNANDNDLTLTDKFSRDFLTSYFNQKEEGKPIDEAFQEGFVNEVLSQNTVSTGTVYTRNDIVVISANDTASLKSYGNATGAVFRVNRLPQSAEDPLVILQRAFQNQDEAEIRKLEGFFETSKKIVGGLLATPAPSNLVDKHLQLVNAMSVISENFLGMSEGLVDPLKAVLHIQLYSDSSVANMREAVKNIGDYFRENNISFQQQEDGGLIMNTI